MQIPLEILEKVERFCAYRERSSKEVREKLRELKVEKDLSEVILLQLSEDGFIDDERFAMAFVRGKFSLKKWGRKQILNHLLTKGISKSTAEKALEQLDQDHYLQTARDLASKKINTIKGERWERKKKLYRFLLSKGYEGDITMKICNELFD